MIDFLQKGFLSFFSFPSLFSIAFPSCFSFFPYGLIGFPVPNNLADYLTDCLFKVSLFQLTLPDNDDAPPFGLQLTPYFLIPFLVPGNLGNPKLGVGFGDRIIFTLFVAMPKAAVYENDCSILGQHYIRPPGKALVIHSVPKAMMPQLST